MSAPRLPQAVQMKRRYGADYIKHQFSTSASKRTSRIILADLQTSQFICPARESASCS